MVLQFHVPGQPLCGYISHFTYYSGHMPTHHLERFLPDGNIEVVIDFSEKPQYIYDNATLAEIQACKRIWISGVRRRAITIPSGRGSEMFIINFRKGMLRPFLGMPVSEITDRVIDGDLVLDRVFLELRERLPVIGAVRARFQEAERLLLGRYGPRLTGNPLVEHAVARIQAAPQALTVQDLAEESGRSPKHLAQIFKDQVGVSPKSFVRILRFQKAVRDIERLGSLDWAGLAVDCGYYDQSHFIADFHAFSGFTPREYLERKNGNLNYVPIG